MEVAVVAAGVVVVLAVVLASLFWLRLRALGHRVGSFECGLRTDRGWRAGIATYTRDHLDWNAVVSLSVRPDRRWLRTDLVILDRGRRQLPEGTSRVCEARCTYRGEEFVLAAQEHALDGLTSWLEAAPPGPAASHLV